MTGPTRLPGAAEPSAARRVLVSGATGLIGSALWPELIRNGYAPVALVRRPAEGAVTWAPHANRIDAASLDGFEAVVHLAGEDIASGRWTTQKKRKIYSSRVDGTRLLARTLADLAIPPRVFVQASGVGYYGDRGHRLLRETSGPGHGFLADVCRDW